MTTRVTIEPVVVTAILEPGTRMGDSTDCTDCDRAGFCVRDGACLDSTYGHGSPNRTGKTTP